MFLHFFFFVTNEAFSYVLVVTNLATYLMAILMSRDVTIVNVAVKWVNNIMSMGWTSNVVVGYASWAMVVGAVNGDLRAKQMVISTSECVTAANVRTV